VSGGTRRLAALLALALAVTGAIVIPRADAGTAPPVLVFNGEANRLNAYDATTGAKQTVIPSAADDPARGRDINAELCFLPDSLPWIPDGERYFVAGEDTEQNTEPGVIKQGWGIFRLRGERIGRLSARQIGKLVPQSFVTESDNPENYGCGALPDGRLLTTDVGDQLPHSPATGQLIVWFPDASHMQGPLPGDNWRQVPHCKIDVAIGTAGGAHVDGTDVYVASNRPGRDGNPAGVYRYDSTRWPTMGADGAIEGCDRQDRTGAPLADEDRVGKSLFIPQSPLLVTPSDVVDSGRGTFYVSSVFTGHVAEFDKATGLFRRYVLQPPAGLPIGQLTGITPFGIGVAPDGTLWVADIGVVGPGPAPDAGSVVRVRFDAAGDPLPPETIDDGLQFPDGIGVLAPG
jgi:hypothetical protein